MVVKLQFWRFKEYVPLSLQLLPDPIWPGVRVPVGTTSMGQIHLFKNYKYWMKPYNCVQANDYNSLELLMLGMIVYESCLC